ncbi:MAG: alpha/beta hydrolase [Proteobacteria bacterium]|nr:alpha/beta hydrolase [Pseudomonadota bacterium]
MLKKTLAVLGRLSGLSGKSMKAKCTAVFLRLAVTYLLLLLGLTMMQREMLYHPTHDMKPPKAYQLSMDEVHFRAEDSTLLTAWYHPPREGQKVIVYFHGNALHLGARHKKFRTYMNGGFGLLALSYRGFGTSEGTPTEKGLYEDARAAVHYVISSGVPEKDIVLYGESLGTGVATQMATEFPHVAALVLEAPYTSVVNRAQELFFYIPVSLVLQDRFDSIDKMPNVKVPVLFFHGEADAVIPIEHGKALYAVCTAPKEAKYFPGIHHTDFPWQQLAADMQTFLKKYDR